MPNKIANRVKMTVSGAPGTGPITLGSAVSGFQSFASAGVSNADTVPYVLEDSSSWEIGVGTYTASGTSLARTSITASSNSGSAISATANSIVMISPLAADLQAGTAAGNLVQLDGSAKLPAVDGSALTALNGSNISTGTIAAARIDTGTSANKIIALDSSAKYPAADGSLITNLNMGAAASGTLSVERGGTGLTSLTAGYIPYGNGTGALGNSSSLAWDTASNALLIGTSKVDGNWKVQANASASGLTGIGVNNNGGYGVYLTYDNSGRYGAGAASVRNIANSPLVFETNNSEKMRIDISGRLLVGETSFSGPTYGKNAGVYSSVTNDLWGGLFRNKGTSGLRLGIAIQYNASAPNDTSNDFIVVEDSSAIRFTLRSNGGIANYQGNDVNLSDQRLKRDISNAKSYLDKICAIPVRTFRFKDQTHDDLNIGVIAQEVEAIAPELVDNDGFGDTPADGIPYKAIYQTDLQYALMKCIQELAAKVSALEAKQ